MRQRPFGRTGWLVSEIGFGTWPIGSAWGPVKDSESLDALRVSLDEVERKPPGSADEKLLSLGARKVASRKR